MERAGVWEYSDRAFEEFSRRIRTQLSQASFLWSMRDAVFYSLTYRQTNQNAGNRHRLGLLTWLPWLLKSLVVSIRKKPLSSSARRCDAQSHFLFYGWHASHHGSLLPLLEEKSRSARCCVWAHSLRDAQLSDLRAMKDVDVVDLTDWQPPPRAVLQGAFMALKSGPMTWFHVRTAIGKSPDFRHWSFLYEMYYNLGIWRTYWKYALKGSVADCYYVTSESSPLAKAFVSRGLAAGARIFHICHGLPHAAHAVTRSTDLVPFTEADANWFRERVPSTCQIHTGGNPRMNVMKEKVGPPRRRPTGDKLHVLFFAQGVETPYTKEMMKEDLSILKLPEGLAHLVDLRIRIHPRETVMSTKDIVDEVGLQVSAFSSGPLEEDLAWSDVCATSWSTALLEGIACGRQAFWINARNDRLARTGLLMDAGYGELVKSNKRWHEVTAKILDISIL